MFIFIRNDAVADVVAKFSVWFNGKKRFPTGACKFGTGKAQIEEFAHFWVLGDHFQLLLAGQRPGRPGALELEEPDPRLGPEAVPGCHVDEKVAVDLHFRALSLHYRYRIDNSKPLELHQPAQTYVLRAQEVVPDDQNASTSYYAAADYPEQLFETQHEILKIRAFFH